MTSKSIISIIRKNIVKKPYDNYLKGYNAGLKGILELIENRIKKNKRKKPKKNISTFIVIISAGEYGSSMSFSSSEEANGFIDNLKNDKNFQYARCEIVEHIKTTSLPPSDNEKG